jgi:hypothetical protein
MHLTLRCPGCDKRLPVSAAESADAIRCGGCGRETALVVSDAVRTDSAVDVCPACGERDFYSRKDFDQKTGLTFIVVAALVSAGFYFYGMDLVAYGILAGAVVLDLIVSRMLGEVTVCYRCHTEFRGAYPKTAPAFDLHIADVLEPEYERKIGRR